MTYEVPTRRVSGGSPRSLLVPIIAALGILTAGIIGAATSSDPAGHASAPNPSATDPRQAAPRATPRPAVVQLPSFPPPYPRRGPVQPPLRVDCGVLPSLDCSRAVFAAQLALHPDYPTILSAEVSRSLICSDDFDCPRSLLAQSRSVGSVVFRFAESDRVAWINVVELATNEAAPRRRADMLGYVVRWFVQPIQDEALHGGG